MTDRLESSLVSAAALREAFEDAQAAVHALWEPSAKTFWRSTVQRERETSEHRAATFYPTVTFRCLNALQSACNDKPAWVRSKIKEDLQEFIAPSIVTRTLSDLSSSTLQHGAEPNIFTLSVYCLALAKILGNGTHSKQVLDGAKAQLQGGLQVLRCHAALDDASIASLHPFLAYNVKRVLVEASRLTVADNEALHAIESSLIRHCRSSVLSLLAKQVVGSLNHGEAVALAFCAATMLRHTPGSRDRHFMLVTREDEAAIRAALSVCISAQDSSGCWPLGRVVDVQKDISPQQVSITTYEVTTAVAEGVLALLSQPKGRADDLIATAVGSLTSSLRYAEKSVVRLNDCAAPHVGWCSDHAYGASLIESWASATLLEALLRTSDAVEEFNKRIILSDLGAVHAGDRDWPTWLRWDKFKTNGEVDYAAPILSYLDRHIVQPILAEPSGLPSGERRTTSVLLFGPPGTSKTTIAMAVAEGLGWPVLLLNPGTFIERGLEYIEAQARSVFDKLLSVNRAVVVFDECDELFRDRKPRPESEQVRGITAFVTASMLPKLQDLHDRGRVVFFICTNNFHAMDPAVKRGGRIDHVIGVGPPDSAARRKIVMETWTGLVKSKRIRFANEALGELIGMTERFTRSELVRVVGSLYSLAVSSPFADEDRARLTVKSLVDEYRGGLTITDEDYTKFKADYRQFSHARLEGGSQ